MPLTRKGWTFICNKKLKGRKYAEQYYGEQNVFYVSPAVYSLLENETDAEKVVSQLKVKEIQRPIKAFGS